MPVTFVTALFLPQGSQDAKKYIDLAVWIVTANVPLVIYTTLDLATLMRDAWPPMSHVRIVEDVPMEDYWEKPVILPQSRNLEKDTAFYMSIQLTKLKVCTHAAKNCDTDLLCWIDFGLFKISQNKGRFWLTLKSLANASCLERILSPGGYDSHPVDPLNQIRWKNLGGVLLGPKKDFSLAYDRQKQLVETHLPRLAWEVNYCTEEGLSIFIRQIMTTVYYRI